MKNKKLSITRLGWAMVIAAVVGFIAMAAFGGSLAAFGIGGGVSFLLSAIPGNTKGLAMMALQTEMWVERIEHNMFMNNEFLKESIDDSQYVTVKTVHVPNANETGDIIVDGVYPAGGADVNAAADREKTYDISEFRVPPFIVRNAEKVELSYNQMDSLLYENQSKLSERIASQILYKWAPTGTALLSDGETVNNNILRTSGVPKNDQDAAPLKVNAHLAGASGYRLAFGMYDVLQASTLLNSLDVPMADRSMLLDATMYSQLVKDMSATQFTDFSASMDPKTGQVGMLYGFKIFMRSKVLSYTNADLPVVKAIGAAGASTDNAAAIFWWKGAVSRAVGQTEVYSQDNDPKNYGDVASALTRAGGAPRRDTELGIGAIVQKAPAVGV
ncbi:hypothetical protein CJD36_019900 [Flavipsychrobacter stenotrophus]|uniref:Uncharacterized protein n=1 Tax=Flavipsychrobacter stenotrophus TaxID=2077091 RepID=A0A2S7SSC8_9BACT|nr:phage capsid protein [Flavipsychrobacter stenotrophus]PQJ09505.1 hypothetical protein CJD36_019900 [Flavipsychrobacter stenotrophus]